MLNRQVILAKAAAIPQFEPWSTRRNWDDTAWDTDLDHLRAIGDPAADKALELWLERQSNPKSAVRELAEKLTRLDPTNEIDELIDVLRRQQQDLANDLDPQCDLQNNSSSQQDFDIAADLFKEHGLKIFLILVCCSLPAAFAAQNGVRVLHSDNGSTGYFVKDLNRRLIETSQFLIEVFSPGSLTIRNSNSCSAHGRAIQTALRIRLLHAAVRHMVVTNLRNPPEGDRRNLGSPTWNLAAFGIPANQEDIAGTLMTFSLVVLDGLQRMEVSISDDQRNAYFAVWMTIGMALGVKLLPPTVEDGRMMMVHIKRRQIDRPIQQGIKNTFGIDMTDRLLVFVRKGLPKPLGIVNLPAAITRFLLPHDIDVAKSLGIPETPLLEPMVGIWFWWESHLSSWAWFKWLNRAIYVKWSKTDDRALGLFMLSRAFSKHILRNMRNVDRPGRLRLQLHDWDRKWALNQKNFIRHGWLRLREKVGKPKKQYDWAV